MDHHASRDGIGALKFDVEGMGIKPCMRILAPRLHRFL